MKIALRLGDVLPILARTHMCKQSRHMRYRIPRVRELRTSSRLGAERRSFGSTISRCGRRFRYLEALKAGRDKVPLTRVTSADGLVARRPHPRMAGSHRSSHGGQHFSLRLVRAAFQLPIPYPAPHRIASPAATLLPTPRSGSRCLLCSLALFRQCCVAVVLRLSLEFPRRKRAKVPWAKLCAGHVPNNAVLLLLLLLRPSLLGPPSLGFSLVHNHLRQLGAEVLRERERKRERGGFRWAMRRTGCPCYRP